ncbi:hypothetical protein FACS1894110_09350 [Spirochaetia bacterium]|nr:hypothetical protein FACS1894110_09350 [Spirochaetia bacterium]
MRSVKGLFVLLAGIAAIGFVGCGGTPMVNTQAKEKYEKLDDKGAGFGIETPRWLSDYIGGGNTAVQKLYKDSYVFVIETADADKDYAVAWVSGAEGPRAVSQKVSTSVVSQMESSQQGEKGSEMESSVDNVTKALSDASFSGLSKDADWWITRRNLESKVVETQAFALWIIDRKELNRQIAANIQNIVDNNTAMSAAERAIYAALISDITGVGLENN